jgi:hypothetical protein
MPYYRLYLTDASGHIFSCRDYESDSDDLAIERAEELRGDARAELWQERRKVHTFAAGAVRKSGDGRGPAGLAWQARDLPGAWSGG